jgi:acyl-CoA thioester hydrolase
VTSPSSTAHPLDPAKTTSSTALRVRFGETDLMGIVHHASYRLYFEAGRVEWLRKRGVTYASFASRGVHLPVVDAHVHYASPARFDDLLDIETTLSELRTVSMKFSYVVTRDGQPIADGYTRLGCIDDAHKLLRIPEDMRAVLLSGETS